MENKDKNCFGMMAGVACALKYLTSISLVVLSYSKLLKSAAKVGALFLG